MESITQPTQTTAPAPSAAQIGSVPSSASQYATSVQYASPEAPQALNLSLGQHPAYQASAPAAPASAAPAAAANPWQEAFQALSATLNTPQASQAPASYSAYQTPTPQASTQASWGSPQAQGQQVWGQQAQQTSVPQASTQAYSASEVQQLLAQQQAQVQSQLQSQAVSASDGYLAGISDVSLEVLEHFGSEAPALLNNYACAVEDALIEQVGRNQSMNTLLNAAGEERAAMNIMLTNPDVLSDYVCGFFGPEGPYPTETAEETQQRQALEARQQFANEIEQQEQRNVPSNFERPQMDMPTPGRAQSPQRSFWGDFSSMMDNNPEQAWQFLAGAPQQAFQQKLLVQDY